MAEISGEDGRKMSEAGASWRQVATEMSHDSSKMGNDSAKIAILGSTWELLGWFWEHFWSILAPGLDSKKH